MTARVPLLLPMAFSAILWAATPIQARELVVAYVPNWVDLDSFSDAIDYSKITHINIAFENPANEKRELAVSDHISVATEI